METTKPLEDKRIVTELAKINITETVLERFKVNYLPLVINGIGDKEGYAEVSGALKECSKARIETVKLCKKSREEAIAVQKAWVAKEKEIVGKIEPVETHLKQEVTKYEEAVEKEKVKAYRLIQLPGRKQQLTQFGAAIPTDEVLLGMDDVAFMTYVNNERTRILNKKEAELAKAAVTDRQTVMESMPVVIEGKQMNAIFFASSPSFTPPPVKNLSDKELLTSFAEQLYSIRFPIVVGKEAQELIAETQSAFNQLAMTLATKAQTLTT